MSEIKYSNETVKLYGCYEKIRYAGILIVDNLLHETNIKEYPEAMKHIEAAADSLTRALFQINEKYQSSERNDIRESKKKKS